jgi:hypothetical protein
MSRAYVGNSQVSIKIGSNPVLKAYRGSNILYNPISVPGSPTNVSASLSGKDAIVSFSAPASDGGSAITNYIVQYSSNNGSSWTTFNRANSTATSNITVNTLSYNISYIFRVIAVNNIGNSSPSTSSSSVTTPSPVVSPLSLANGFLSALRLDTIPDSEFPNAALANGFLSALRLNPLTAAELPPKISIANGFLSVLRVGDTIPDSEFPNAALANGYLSTLHTDTI